MSAPFRFLDLPNELRLKMYRFILPRQERIHLDPDEVIFPIPYIVDESYGSAGNILQVCKKIHGEATEFIYTQNTVNIIRTASAGNFLEGLGGTACQYISKLECHVDIGLVDIGDIWQTMSECPRLTDLRLVFYHEPMNWSKTLAQLTIYRQAHEEHPVNVDVELHTSIWATRYMTMRYSRQFNMHLQEATRHNKVYTWELPRILRHITIAASVHQHAADQLEKWCEPGIDWRFVPVLNVMSNEMRKTLRFEKLVDNGVQLQEG